MGVNRCEINGPDESEAEHVVEHELLLRCDERGVALGMELKGPHRGHVLADLNRREPQSALHSKFEHL